MAHNTISRFCENCGATFKTNNHDIQNGHGRFCSMKCYHSARKTTYVNIVCETCKHIFQVELRSYNDRIKKDVPPRFCSRACSAQSPKQIEKSHNNALALRTSETKTKIKQTKNTPEYKERARENQKGILAKFKDKMMEGVKRRNASPEWSAYWDSQRGEGNPNWKGGGRKQRQTEMGRREYIAWRTSVFQRDNYTCQKCDRHGGELHAHHIKEWAKYPELRYVVSNGLTVCIPCHLKIHHG